MNGARSLGLFSLRRGYQCAFFCFHCRAEAVPVRGTALDVDLCAACMHPEGSWPKVTNRFELKATERLIKKAFPKTKRKEEEFERLEKAV